MKSRLRVLVLLLAVALAAPLHAAEFWTLLSASNTVGATTPVDSGGATYVGVHVWRADAAAASTSVVYLQGSVDKVKWVRLATFTNVTGMDATYGDGGTGVSVPSWPFMRLYVASCSTGTLSAKGFKR